MSNSDIKLNLRQVRMQLDLGHHKMATNAPTRYGWTTTVNNAQPHAEGDSRLASGKLPKAIPSGRNRFSDLALPKDKTITVSIIAGPSKGLKHEFTTPLVSIGRRGAGADVQLDDPKISGVHCVIGVKEEMIRLCDLDSTDGTYVNDERIQAAGLEHLSEFRIGASWFLLTVLTKRDFAAD